MPALRERDLVEGLTDETTIGQLAGLLYEIDSRGRMKIESKEKARERGVPSPDRADALMFALCKPRQKFEYYSARDLPRLRSGSGERGALDDDDRPRGALRGRRFWDAWAPGSLGQLRGKGAW